MPYPYPGDQYRDGMHDVLMGDVYVAEAKLANQGVSGMYFRIACFSDAPPGNPLYDVPVDDFCVPGNDEPPPATGTTDLQLMGRIMAMSNGFLYGSRFYDQVRAGAPTAVQYSTDDGQTWQWISDLVGKTQTKAAPEAS